VDDDRLGFVLGAVPDFFVVGGAGVVDAGAGGDG